MSERYIDQVPTSPTCSISSFEFIPSPHNKIASLHGPPKWHYDYKPPKEAKKADGDAFQSSHADTHSQGVEFPTLTPQESQDIYSPNVECLNTVGCITDYGHNINPLRYPPFSDGGRFNNPSQSLAATGHYVSPAVPFPYMSTGASYPQSFPPPPGFKTFKTCLPQSLIASAPALTLDRPFNPSTATAEQIAAKLMTPPSHFISPQRTVQISLPWVVEVVGSKHLEFSQKIHRIILKKDSELRTRGAEFGLLPEYVLWLCGDEGHRTNVLRPPCWNWCWEFILILGLKGSLQYNEMHPNFNAAMDEMWSNDLKMRCCRKTQHIAGTKPPCGGMREVKSIDEGDLISYSNATQNTNLEVPYVEITILKDSNSCLVKRPPPDLFVSSNLCHGIGHQHSLPETARRSQNKAFDGRVNGPDANVQVSTTLDLNRICTNGLRKRSEIGKQISEHLSRPLARQKRHVSACSFFALESPDLSALPAGLANVIYAPSSSAPLRARTALREFGAHDPLLEIQQAILPHKKTLVPVRKEQHSQATSSSCDCAYGKIAHHNPLPPLDASLVLVSKRLHLFVVGVRYVGNLQAPRLIPNPRQTSLNPTATRSISAGSGVPPQLNETVLQHLPTLSTPIDIRCTFQNWIATCKIRTTNLGKRMTLPPLTSSALIHWSMDAVFFGKASKSELIAWRLFGWGYRTTGTSAEGYAQEAEREQDGKADVEDGSDSKEWAKGNTEERLRILTIKRVLSVNLRYFPSNNLRTEDFHFLNFIAIEGSFNQKDHCSNLHELYCSDCVAPDRHSGPEYQTIFFAYLSPSQGRVIPILGRLPQVNARE
ncbi:uncharacterized protein BDR25DRAFT_362675 [Lindgomyces ingoldianus]|uniref:Uncharacterized protein n=1 Tax=Lindgomyces ingoldianus TaxID=673940 RepID=A0ACB6Q9C7_9PLEO|nr:uncharacterized protein BDR25DRAFT_362675 [Lindgomyces ingoldianus]KAF2463502.1 hypothetical protein BDR25DRAFT_362675 [Lindgomyces ingoldianus]